MACTWVCSGENKRWYHPILWVKWLRSREGTQPLGEDRCSTQVCLIPLLSLSFDTPLDNAARHLWHLSVHWLTLIFLLAPLPQMKIWGPGGQITQGRVQGVLITTHQNPHDFTRTWRVPQSGRHWPSFQSITLKSCKKHKANTAASFTTCKTWEILAPGRRFRRPPTTAPAHCSNSAFPLRNHPHSASASQHKLKTWITRSQLPPFWSPDKLYVYAFIILIQ